MTPAEIERYEYPVNGAYNETDCILKDGRTLWVNTQYATVTVKHAAPCAKTVAALDPKTPEHPWGTRNVCEINAAVDKATCTCGALDGIDTDAIIADARKHGLKGYKPSAVVLLDDGEISEAKGAGWCDDCESYCYGDCHA